MNADSNLDDLKQGEFEFSAIEKSRSEISYLYSSAGFAFTVSGSKKVLSTVESKSVIRRHTTAATYST